MHYDKRVQFIDFNIPIILEDFLKNIDEKMSMVDLGCGDGRILFALNNKMLLNNINKVIGVDISKERIYRLESSCPFAKGIISDICNMKELDDNSFDIVISSQVIEHVDNDSKMLSEIYRIIKPYKYVFLSTVIKRWYGIYIHWNNGFKLDPTHKKEYKNSEEFLSLLKTNGFEIINYKISEIEYPILDIIIRALLRFDLIKPSSEFYLNHNTLNKLRSLMKIKILGYRNIDVICKAIK